MSNSRYPIVTQTTNGYCPAQVTPSASKQVLTQDPGAAGPTWETPPIATATSSGDVPTPPNNTTTFLRGDATFAAVTGSALTIVTSNLGTVGTNQTVDCSGACLVHIRLTISASITLTLHNLRVGTPVTIVASSTGTFTLKLAATDPNSVAYVILGYNSAGGGFNYVTSGGNYTSTTAFVNVGNSVYVSGTPTLDLGLA